jgi:hypothetical protein
MLTYPQTESRKMTTHESKTLFRSGFQKSITNRNHLSSSKIRTSGQVSEVAFSFRSFTRNKFSTNSKIIEFVLITS